MQLNLHRSSKKPDWLQMPEGERNAWQRVAAATHGVLTPANFISFVGFVLALVGIGYLLGGFTWAAIGLLIIGRLLDIADGAVAQKTGTKSSLGEKVDATADKIITGLSIIAMFVANVAPWWLLALLILPHLVIAAIVIISRARNNALHPSRSGKIAMALTWMAVAALLFLKALELTWPRPLVVIVDGFALVSVALTSATAIQYALLLHRKA